MSKLCGKRKRGGFFTSPPCGFDKDHEGLCEYEAERLPCGQFFVRGGNYGYCTLRGAHAECSAPILEPIPFRAAHDHIHKPLVSPGHGFVRVGMFGPAYICEHCGVCYVTESDIEKFKRGGAPLPDNEEKS